MPLLVTRSLARQVLDFAEVIEAVESAHAALAQHTAEQADRQALLVAESDVLLVPMLAASTGARAAGFKLLADAPRNPERRAPRQQSTIVLVDPVTGRCEAVLDGAAITLYRTAAASAVATRHLARPDASRLGLVGAGAQAWAHIEAIRAVRPIDEVVVWSRTAASARALVRRCTELGLSASVAPDVRTVASTADVLCTVTPSQEPLVLGAWLPDGAHVNVVGAPPRPTHREVDTAVLARGRVVVDDIEVALAESGAVQHALDDRTLVREDLADLGAVIAGTAVGRSTPDEVTVYTSVGVGIQDVVTARVVVDALEKLGLGDTVDLTA